MCMTQKCSKLDLDKYVLVCVVVCSMCLLGPPVKAGAQLRTFQWQKLIGMNSAKSEIQEIANVLRITDGEDV